eukprot:9745085-Lingulodinium_polyedra.AAC.1
MERAGARRAELAMTSLRNQPRGKPTPMRAKDGGLACNRKRHHRHLRTLGGYARTPVGFGSW